MEEKKQKCPACGSENTSKLYLSWNDYFSPFLLSGDRIPIILKDANASIVDINSK